MAVLGIACRLEQGRPIVEGVRFEGKRGSLTGQSVFRHVADSRDDIAQQLRSLSEHLETHLREASYGAVVVRSLDWSRQRREEMVRKRYQVEGALLAVARRFVDRTESLNGRDTGAVCGSDKRAAEAEAAAIVGEKLKEAGAAALAASIRLVGG